MSHCINHCPLRKEAPLTQAESGKSLWVQGSLTTRILTKCQYYIPPEVVNLPNHKLLASFIVTGTYSFHADSKFNQESVSYPPNIHAPLHQQTYLSLQMGTVTYNGHREVRSLMPFLPQQPSTFSTMNGGQKGGSLQLSSSFMPESKCMVLWWV